MLRQGRRVQAARRHDRLRLARRAAGRAALRSGGAAAAGQVGSTGRHTRPSSATAGSPRRPTRRSSPPACASGAAARRRSRPRALGHEGRERKQFLAGEPCSLRLRSRPMTGSHRRALTRDARRGWPARRVGRSTPVALGWRTARATCVSTSPGCRSPTAASTSGSASSTRPASACCTRSTTRYVSSSIPAGETRLVRLDGSWAAQKIPSER